MITRRTRIQLLVFVIITLVGVTYTGARYAQLDRAFVDRTYTVVAHFPESGGIFAGGEVTYRGVGIGQVSKMDLTDRGVDVYLEIEKDTEKVPADTLAVVGNRSAVGEQYVELQPRTDDGPFLENKSEIQVANTRTPIQTDELLTNLSDTISSVDIEALRTTVLELGTAFDGTGRDLQRIIDTGNSFLAEADANFETQSRLIRNTNVVLNGQIASESGLRTFASQLSLFSGSLVNSDGDLRRVIDSGSGAANQLRTFIQQNEVELGSLINNLITTGEIIVKNLPGIQQTLVIYPYVVEGGFTVVSKSPDTGLFDAHFGMIITEEPICSQGYISRDQRRDPESDRGNAPMAEGAGCTEPAAMSNARGPQNLPRTAPVVASFDPEVGELTWGDTIKPSQRQIDQVAPQTLGEESWKWLFLQPLTSGQE